MSGRSAGFVEGFVRDLALAAAGIAALLGIAYLVQVWGWRSARRLEERCEGQLAVTSGVPESARRQLLLSSEHVVSVGMLLTWAVTVRLIFGGESRSLTKWAARERRRVLNRLRRMAIQRDADGLACVRIVPVRVSRRGRFKLGFLVSGDAYFNSESEADFLDFW